MASLVLAGALSKAEGGAHKFPTSERIRAAGRITLSCVGTFGALTKWMQPKPKKRAPDGFNSCSIA